MTKIKSFACFLLTIFVCLPMYAKESGDANNDLDKVRESFVKTVLDSYSPSEEVTENFLRYSENGRAAIDVLLLQLYLDVQLPAKEVERVMDLFDFDRRQWNDINYADMSRGGWDMTLHVTRILALAKSYECQDSAYYKNPKLSELLHKAAGWWFDNKPINPNWWHNDIGVPKKFVAAMVLLRDELSQEEIDGTLYVLERSKFGRTGQNKAWLAGNQLMKALLIDDPQLARVAQQQIAEEIYIAEAEGIQKDWSFHQHGPQLQFGNYGLAFADGVSFWVRVLNGTSYAFSEKQVNIVESYILNGLCWTLWNGFMDPSACGRQLHIDGGRGKAYTCAVAALNMAALNRPRSEEFKQIAKQNFQPESYQNELVGAKYYPCSDFGIYRTKDWYASVRMHSQRTIGYEHTNAENLLAQFSADGAVLVMQSGKEYENIFPYWDWRMLPGVTAYEDGAPLKVFESKSGIQNNSKHVAGVAQDGKMLTTMELDRNGLHAFKTNFFLDDIIVSLGSDIRKSNPAITRITTALDQNHLNGKLSGGSFKSRSNGSVDWLWHDDRGYVSLDGKKLHHQSSLQSGSWSKMAPIYSRSDSGMVFKTWIEHDVDECSSYAYAILPCRSESQVKKFAKAYSTHSASSSNSAKGASVVTVLRNDQCCQAILYRGNLYAVIHRAGSYTLDGWTHNFTQPCVCMKLNGDCVIKTMPMPNIPENSYFDYSKTASLAHPRLFFPSGEESVLLEAFAKVPQLKTVHKAIIDSSDRLIDKPLPEYVMTGKRLLDVSRNALRSILYFSYAYRMTGDARYAEAAKKVTLKVCSFTDWNPSHFLDTSEMALAVAIAYDWLYPMWTAGEKKILSDALYEKALKASKLPKVWFRRASNNWNSVCNAGLVAASIACFENYPKEAAAMIDECIATNWTAMATYAPAGCYPEGYSYWQYGSEFQMLMNEALISAFGSDAGLGDSAGFYESSRFMAYMQAPSGSCFNFSDGSSSTPLMLSLFHFADKAGNPALAKPEYRKLIETNGKINDRILPLNLIFASKSVDAILSIPHLKELPSSCYFPGEMPVYVYRGGWDSTKDSYLAVKGGSASSNHAHMDAGSFVYEYGGFRWSVDLGLQSYYSLEKLGMDIWNMSQDSERWSVYRYDNQSHSTLTLNNSHHRVMGFATIEKIFDSKNRRGVELDMTDIFGKMLVSKASRRIYLDSKDFLHIEDKIVNSNTEYSELSDANSVNGTPVVKQLPLEVKWLMNTFAEAEIIDAKSIRLSYEGFSMLLTIDSNIDFTPIILSNNSPNTYDAPNKGCRVGFVSTIGPCSTAEYKCQLLRDFSSGRED